MDRPRTYAYGTPIVLLVVFVLSFLACVSIPISQSITLFDLDVRQADAGIRAGLWGYCVPDSTIHGLQCSKPRIGWDFKNTSTSDTCPFPSSSSTDARICTGVLNDLGNLVPPRLTDALLIHVFATVLAFVTFVLALVFALRPDLHQRLGNRLRYSNSNEPLTQTIASLFLPLLFTLQLAAQITIALILDIVVVSIAKRNATKSEVTVTYGSVTWITLVSAILVWGVLAIQIAKRPRNQASRSRQRHEIFDLRSSRTSRLSTFSPSSRSLQSRSLTTPSQSDTFGAAESFTDQSRSAAESEAPGKSISLFCCGVSRSRKPRELLEPGDREDVPTSPSAPPQHRRFSWEPHEDDESYSPSDAHSDSTNEDKQHYNQCAQSPMFACLPCLKRSKPNPGPPEDIELQDIVVSQVQDDSSSVYSQSAASVQEMRDGTSDGGPNSTSNHENKPDASPSYLTWANIRKALQEMFTLRDKKNESPVDDLKGEEQGDVSENAETRSFDEQDVIQVEVAEDRRLEEAVNESAEQERVSESNKSSADDVPLSDDKVLPEERQEVQSDHKPDQEGAMVNEVVPEETLELVNDVDPALGSQPELGDADETEALPVEAMEDDASRPSDEEPTELVDKAEAEPEDKNSDDTEGVLEENVFAEEDSAPAPAGEEFQKPDYANEYETVTEDTVDEEVEPETVCEEDQPTAEPYTENVDPDPEGDPSVQEGDCVQKEVDATSDSEKVEVSCREADEVRPDNHVVKRHSFVEVMENVPGRPLILRMPIAVITPLFLFAAFLLLLLVTLSVPFLKSIDLFKLSAKINETFGSTSASANATVRFGVWGYCLSAIEASAAGQSFNDPAQCSKPHLGYTIDGVVAGALHAEGIENDIPRAITTVLVLHPVACGVAFIAFLHSLALLSRPSWKERACAALTLAITFVAAVLATIVFLIDIVAIVVARDKIKDNSGGEVATTWGSATWMTLAATVLLWVSCLGACCGIFACSRQISNRRRRAFTY